MGGGGGGLIGSVLGFVGQTLGGLFGSSYDEPDPPSYDIPKAPEAEIEPTSKAVRNSEAQKLKARRGMSGTILTSPLGALGGDSSVSGLLGRTNTSS